MKETGSESKRFVHSAASVVVGIKYHCMVALQSVNVSFLFLYMSRAPSPNHRFLPFELSLQFYYSVYHDESRAKGTKVNS